MNRKKIKQFKELEKRIAEKLEGKCENTIVLSSSDFKDGKLSSAGYNRLKQECEYISHTEDIKIVLPEEYLANFKETLENMAANETLYIRKDMREINIYSILFLLTGMLWFTVGSFITNPVIHEITIVATWVFVWTALEKWFFDGNRLKKRKFNLLNILSAKWIVSGCNLPKQNEIL